MKSFSFSDLKKKYIESKNLLSEEALKLLLFGDSELIKGNNKYRVISQLEYRWCLKSILMYHLHKKLPPNIKGCHYESKNELISDLENIFQEGDKVLVKASKSVGLSSIVDAIRAMKN